MQRNPNPQQSHHLILKNHTFVFDVYAENDLSWPQHNDIHFALNRAYAFRTQSFLKKSYGYCIPKKRILVYQNKKLVGHTAIFEDYVLIEGEKVFNRGDWFNLIFKAF